MNFCNLEILQNSDLSVFSINMLKCQFGVFWGKGIFFKGGSLLSQTVVFQNVLNQIRRFGPQNPLQDWLKNPFFGDLNWGFGGRKKLIILFTLITLCFQLSSVKI